MIRTKEIYFDSTLKCRSGKRIPYWDITTTDDDIKDQDLRWFHEGYGFFRLYRLHKVDDVNFIAEDLYHVMRTGNENWDLYIEHPELLLAEG